MCYNIILAGKATKDQKGLLREMFGHGKFYLINPLQVEKVIRGKFLENIATGDCRLFTEGTKTDKIMAATANVLVIPEPQEEKDEKKILDLLKNPIFIIYFISLVVQHVSCST